MTTRHSWLIIFIGRFDLVETATLQFKQLDFTACFLEKILRWNPNRITSNFIRLAREPKPGAVDKFQKQNQKLVR